MGATREPGHTGKLERSPLESDLVWAADQPLRNCYRLANDQHEVDHPTLARTVRSIVGDQQWHEDPNGSLIRVLRDAIARIPEELNGRRPEQPPDKVNADSKWHGKPERRIAAVLYGVGSDLPDRRYPDGTEVPRNYGAYYRPVAFEVAGLDGLNDTDKARVTRVIRQDLADVLVAMEQEAIDHRQQATEHTAQAEPAEQQPGDTSRQYINRPEYEAWFDEHRQKGIRIFLLYGDAGTGKTTLARHFGEIAARGATAIADSGIPAHNQTWPLVEIGTRTSAALHGNLLRALRRHGMDIPLQHVLAREQHIVIRELFRELLESPQAPGVVLLDNAEEESGGDIRDLISDMSESTIIITSRYRLKLPKGAMALLVGEMTAAEASAMVHSQLTGVSDDDASALARDLGNRPLAIRHACGFISQDSMAVEAFRRLLKQSIATVLDNVVVDDEQTLTAIYRLTLGRLDADTLRALDLIAIMGGQGVSVDFLRAAWCGNEPFSSRAQSDESLRSLAFRKALGALERLSLVEPEYLKDTRVTILVHLHPLTTDLILELRQKSHPPLIDELSTAIKNSPVLAAWQPGKSLPLRLALQAITGMRFVASHPELFADNDCSPSVDALFGLQVRAIQQLGLHADDGPGYISNLTREYTEAVARKVDPPFPWNRISVQLPGRRRKKGVLRRILRTRDIQRHGEAQEHPGAQIAYGRAANAWTMEEDELVHFAAIFPLTAEAYEGFQTIGIPKEAMVVPYLSQGIEHHPFAEGELQDLLGDWSQHTAPHMAALRKQALRAEHEGRLFEAGNIHFALGTYYFDRSDFTCALASYRRSYYTWLKNDHRYYVGELCKAAVRVADTYYRLGRHTEALAWRMKVITAVQWHIKRYGIEEWPCEYPVNYFLNNALLGRPLPIPPLSQLREDQTEQQERGQADKDTGLQEEAEEAAILSRDDWFVFYFGKGGQHLSAINGAILYSNTAFRTSQVITFGRSSIRFYPHVFMDSLSYEYNSPRTSPLARTKLLLFMVKTRMFLDEIEGKQSDANIMLTNALHAVRVFGLELISPYWYADSLLTAYVLCARYGCGKPEQTEAIFRGLWEAHHRLKRIDRLAIALAARNKNMHFDPLWLFAE